MGHYLLEFQFVEMFADSEDNSKNMLRKPLSMYIDWQEEPKLERYKMHPGDLVMSLTGTVGKNDYGNVCVSGNDFDSYYLNQRNAKLEIKGNLEKNYIAEFLKFKAIKSKLNGINRGVRQANISNRDILSLIVPVPKLELQREFSLFIEQVDKSKFCVIITQ